MALWTRLTAFVLVVGIVLSPLRAVAATFPALFAYDAAVRPTTTALGRQDAVRPQRSRAPEDGYDAVQVGYDGAANPHALDAAGTVHAYDGNLKHADRREVRGARAIYGAAAATTAAEGAGAAAGGVEAAAQAAGWAGRVGAMDARILQAAQGLGSSSGTFMQNVGALARAVGGAIPGGQVHLLGELGGAQIYGSLVSRIGIAEIGGVTQVVSAPLEGAVEILGPLFP